VEVGPRDGLQSEPTVLDAADRVDLIVKLAAAGLTRIEVASFVHPGKVPQMAKAEEVVAALPDDAAVTYVGLVLNHRGLDRALSTKVDEVNFVVPASDGYARSNQGMSTAEATDMAADLIRVAHEAGRKAGVTISVAWGDPYDGPVPVDTVASIARRLAEAGSDDIALGDTIGVAVPRTVREVVDAVHQVSGGAPIRCHFHNTRNTGYANAMAAIDAGVRSLDSAVGGYGGSPFTDDAGGNIATEDLVHMLDGERITTGVNVDALCRVAGWLAGKLGSPNRSMLPRAGVVPGR
jgi:hydroxymethylglutaryl-CoA lyase